MRVDSVSVAKGIGAQSSHLAPKEGTKLRRMYDLLKANKGVQLYVPLSRFEGDKSPRSTHAIEQLRDYYGLDIRNLGYGRWVLAGEWFGATYVDHIADRLHEIDREGVR